MSRTDNRIIRNIGKPNRQRERDDFAVKNDNRRQGGALVARKQRAAARRLRRAFGGAFGRAPDKVFNKCCVGTCAMPRFADDPGDIDDGEA